MLDNIDNNSPLRDMMVQKELRKQLERTSLERKLSKMNGTKAYVYNIDIEKYKQLKRLALEMDMTFKNLLDYIVDSHLSKQ